MGIADVAVGNKIPAAVENAQSHVANALPVQYQTGLSQVLGTSATNIGSAAVFPAVSFASTIELLFIGFATNSATTSRTPVNDSTASGTGVVVLGADGYGPYPASTSTPSVLRLVISVPASTATTIQFAAHTSTAANLTLAGGVTFKQLPQ